MIATAIGLFTLTRDQLRTHRLLFMLAGAVFALVIVQLIPLPPAIWHRLPGGTLVAQIDRLALGMEVWRPLTMTPLATWNALFSLFVPLGVLVLGIQMNGDQHKMLLITLMISGAISGIIGLLQVIGSSESPLYFYEVTNAGASVGLFANRNHQAIFLSTIFPMLSVFALLGGRSHALGNIRLWLMMAGGSMLVPLLLVTGSRSGLLLGGVGLVAAAALIRWGPDDGTKPPLRHGFSRYLTGGGVLGVLVLLMSMMSRADAITRLLDSDELNGPRVRMWKTGWEVMIRYLPFGTGFGSITTAFEIYQPKQSLAPTYVNHLHNDWLEVVATGGVPALLLIIVAIVTWCRASISFLPRGVISARRLLFARLGSIVVLMLGLGSFVDYPLRVPSIACVFVLASIWMSQGWAAIVKDDQRTAQRLASPVARSDDAQ